MRIKICEELENLNDWQGALDCYLKFNNNSDDLDSLKKIAWCYSRLNNFKDSILIYNKILNLDGKSSKNYYMLAYQYYANNQFEEAIKYFNLSIKQFPNYYLALYRCSKSYYQLFRNTNDVHNIALSNELIDRCIKLETNINNKSILAKIFFHKGKLLELKKKHLDAIALFEKSNLYKYDSNNNYNIAKCYYMIKDYESAYNYISKVHLSKNMKETYFKILIGQNRIHDALEIYKIFKKDKIYLLLELSKFYYHNELFDNSLAINNYLIQNCTLVPHKASYMNALVYRKLKDFEKAIQSFELANTLKHKHFNIYYKDALLEINKLKNLVSKSTPYESSNLYFGKITNFNTDRGFGFIETDRKTSHFFHISNCLDRNTEYIKAFEFVFFIREYDENKRKYNAHKVQHLYYRKEIL